MRNDGWLIVEIPSTKLDNIASRVQDFDTDRAALAVRDRKHNYSIVAAASVDPENVPGPERTESSFNVRSTASNCANSSFPVQRNLVSRNVAKFTLCIFK